MMKKLTITMLFLAVASLTFAGERKHSIPQPTTATATYAGVTFYMWGTIGGEEAMMEMNGMNGSFEYNNIKRKLKFVSYNRKTRKLILKEYDLKGRYIGRFTGTYHLAFDKVLGTDVGSYKGVFYNKEGGYANFTLHCD